MFAGRQSMRNFGAAYITGDYRHVLPFVQEGPRLRRRDACFRDGDRKLTLRLPRILRHRRPLQSAFARLIEFRTALNRLRAVGPSICQAEWIRRDPLLERTIKQPAAEFVKSNGLAALGEEVMDRLPVAAEEDVMRRRAERVAADRKTVSAAAGMLVRLEQTDRIAGSCQQRPHRQARHPRADDHIIINVGHGSDRRPSRKPAYFFF